MDNLVDFIKFALLGIVAGVVVSAMISWVYLFISELV